MIWCCPSCRGELRPVGDLLRCGECASTYEIVGGIPDLRVPGDSWIDFEDDTALARDLAAMECSLAELVREVYSRRPGWDSERIALRTREVLEAPARLKSDLEGWLRPVVDADGPLLDLGCGAGMLIAALGAHRNETLGIDVSLTWLVVAKRLITEFGGKPSLAAAMAESLPLRDACVGSVISLDVIEHVRNPSLYLREIDRVLADGGIVTLSTPNRFSLSAEPHVFVWGVGWLPRRWQKGFVRWRSGKSYDDTTLLSSFGLTALMRQNTSVDFKLLIPEIPPEHLKAFRPLKQGLGRIYNRLSSAGVMRAIFLLVGPFFRTVGVKRDRQKSVGGRTEDCLGRH